MIRLPLLLLALGLVCVAAGAATAWPLLQHLGYVLAAVLLFAASTTWASTQRLEISRGPLPVTIVAGEAVSVSYRISKDGLLPALQLSLRDADTGEWVRFGIRGHDSRVVTTHRLMATRGRHEIGAAEVYGEDPFGILRVRSARIDPESVTVYPRPIAVQPISLPSTSGQGSHHRWRLNDADATLGDLRPYHPGDPPSRVHWPSTARIGTLMVTNPETHRPLTVWLLADLGGAHDDGRSPGIAAYLSGEIIARGLSLGAIVAGRDTASIRPSRGNGQQRAVLEALATVPWSRQSQLERLIRLAARIDHPGKLVVVSHSSLAPELARALRRTCPDVTYVAATTGESSNL